jgi:hypothetical protein
MGIMEKIKDIEHEMQRTQKNKGASCTHTAPHTHTRHTFSFVLQTNNDLAHLAHSLGNGRALLAEGVVSWHSIACAV